MIAIEVLKFHFHRIIIFPFHKKEKEVKTNENSKIKVVKL